MKRSVLAGVAVLALALPAFGQSTTITTTESAGATVTIAPAQRTKIREYVVQRKVKPITVEEVRVGATIPEDVELHAVPSDWGPELGRYRYVYSGDEVVLVEPSSRRVIQVIE